MDEYKRNLDEYTNIQELRKMWSNNIMILTQVMVPIATALFGFFSWASQQDFVNQSFTQFLPLFGWLIFAAALLMWRLVVRHIDKQIVRMYPRMLELEQMLGWSTHTRYYYSNLHRRGLKFLAECLGMKPEELGNKSYEQYYEEVAKRKNKGIYSLLLDVWKKHEHKSVTSRGHSIQDGAVFAILVITLIIAIKLQPFF